jgi:N-acetylmuramoyl-L-alanine amidase
MNDSMTERRPSSSKAMVKASRKGNSVLRMVRYIVLTAVFAFSICGAALGQHKNFIIVIDPGHGGKDPGATHGQMLEKEINLKVALSLGSLILREMKGVDVMYTRTEDVFVGLAARGDFANRVGADLFLSIHTNANKSSSPNGSETYVMGADKNEANLEVAKLENEVIKYEQDYSETYAGFDPNSTEMSIILGMLQYAHFESSLSFARLIQKRFATTTPLNDRGAKQGPFAVLWKPTMPRVLTEMGFISNATDRNYIFSERGKDAIVRVLFDAFWEYRESLGTGGDSPAPVETPADRTASGRTPATTTPAPAVSAPVVSVPAVSAPAATAPATGFYIQLAAAKTRISTRDASWGEYRGKVVERSIDGWYKYQLGPYSTDREAAAKLAEVKRVKFRGAFVVEAEIIK